MLVFAYGGAFCLEHPRGPLYRPKPAEQGCKWSAWFSAFIRRLLKAPEIDSVTFIQGPLGQPFTKPTTFVCGRLPGMAQALYSAYDQNWVATQKLGGWNGDTRQWNTARAKAYPERLCWVLAQQFQHHNAMLTTEGFQEEPEGLTAALEILAAPWDAYDENTWSKMAGDFHRDVADRNL